MTWIGEWTIRGVVVFLGIFCVMLATNILGLSKSDNPFDTWAAFWQAMALGFGVCGLLLIEALVRHEGWSINKPTIKISEEEHPPPPPMN
jgi:hypothetical protein